VKELDELMPDGGRSGSQTGMGNLIELQALRALALAAGGEHTAAVAALAEALTMAHPQDNLRVVADGGDPMTLLLGRLIATQPTAQTAAAMPGVIEPLTARELQVLTLLAVGWSNGRIAAELYVTLDTVKKHVGHILEKLGAANRTQAAARARQLGMIG
jgi:LuxR family transcriptional regulator, maltose regulon positive regulatory protein